MRMALTIVTTLVMTVTLCSCGSKKTVSTSQTKKIVIKQESYKPGEKDALKVLKAYAEKDLKTLKSYAAGAQRMVMGDDYFSGKDSFSDKIKFWKGSFEELRYKKDRKNLKDYHYVYAVFYVSSSGQRTAVCLRSTDKKTWKLSGFGKTFVKKDDFEKLSLTILK